MQVALVEMPNFSFDVTIYGGDASLVPGLEQWLSAFMKDRVFRYCPQRDTSAKGLLRASAASTACLRNYGEVELTGC